MESSNKIAESSLIVLFKTLQTLWIDLRLLVNPRGRISVQVWTNYEGWTSISETLLDIEEHKLLIKEVSSLTSLPWNVSIAYYWIAVITDP